MPLSVAILFHFNQHINEYARTASRVCYRGLLKVLRSHPSLKFNIHLSGTLIHALNWLDPEPLDLIRAGLADGQFELLGSTYAQNVAYASDDWNNARQIELHRETLKDAFGVQPAVFWNPERCWRQSLAPIIAGGGYSTTLVEDHILRKAGASSPATFTTRADSHSLTLVADDETLKHKFNLAAWFGRGTQVLKYLREMAARADSESLCAAYAEDAEAMGLWGWENGYGPNQTWAHLDRMLTALEAENGLRLIHLSQAPAPSADLTPIPDGSAAWMDASLKRPGAPYHEDGYTDWFDFHRRSPKLSHFRQTYAIIRSKMGTEAATPGAQRLMRAAMHSYLAHQYEYGCIGVGGLNYRGWEDARAAVAIAYAAKLADRPSEFVLIEDCNGDGSDEVLISDGRQLIIVSAYGGRLLYWADLITGQQFVGNPLPVMDIEYKGSEFAVPEPRPARWLPESDSAQDAVELSDEPPPTRMGRFLPDWIWNGESTPLRVALRPADGGETVQPLIAQTRALADFVTLDGGAEAPPLEWLDSRLEKNGVTFVRYLSDELTLEKSYRLAYHRMVIASYTLRNHDASDRSFRLRVTNELCPDYDDVIRGGRGSLAFIGGDTPGVINTRTQTSVTAQSSRAPQALEQREDFCALTIGLVYDMTIGPRSEQKLEIKLARSKETR
ncbi:MAG: hypothetical protein FJ030_19515 [Chloroflexi bacterium]|nr:hypothetical protein [Chloroflexota bacterium]